MAFVAIGAAVGGSITARWGWDLGFGLLGAGLVGAAVATLIGLPVLRRRGLTIAVITLSFSLMTTAWLLNPQFFGEGARFDWLPPARIERADLFGFIDVRTETRYYFLCLVGAGAGDRRGARHPSLAHRPRADRDPRERTGRQRVRREHAPHARCVAFAISGFLAAFAGALFVHHQNGLQLDTYSASREPRGVRDGRDRRARFRPGRAPRRAVRTRRHVGAPGRLADPRDRRRAARRAARVPRRPRRRVRRPARRAPPPGGAPPRPRRPGHCRAAAPERPRTAADAAHARAPQPAAAVAVRGLDVEYDGVQVLFGVDLDVAPGRDRRAARHERLGQVDACCARSPVSCDRATARHHRRTRRHRTRRPSASRRAASGMHRAAKACSRRSPSRSTCDSRAGSCAIAARPTTTSRDALERFPRARGADARAGGQPLGRRAAAAHPHDGARRATPPAARRRADPRARARRRRAASSRSCNELRDVGHDGLGRRAVARPRARASPTARTSSSTAPSASRARPPELLDRPDLVRAVFLGDTAAGERRAAHRRARRVDGARAAARGRTGSGSTSAASSRSTTCRSTVGRGEIVGFVGANGAGKTTLFDVLSGFIRADAGTITLRGRRRTGHRPRAPPAPTGARALGLGRSFQDGRLFPALTVTRDDRGRARTRGARARSGRGRAAPAGGVALGGRGRATASTSWSRCSGSTSTPTRSCTSCRPARAASSTSRARSRTSRRCCSSTSRRAASPSGKRRRWRPLLVDVRDTLGTSLLVIEHDVPLLRAVAERLVALDLGRVVAVGRSRHGARAIPPSPASFLGSEPALNPCTRAPTRDDLRRARADATRRAPGA